MKELGRENRVVTSYIKQKAEFSINDLINRATSWYYKYRYYFTEKEHTEKVKPEGLEMEIQWDGKRKIDEYFMFNIRVHLFVWRYKPVKLDEEGKIIKQGQGEIEIIVYGDLIKDWRNTYPKKGFGDFLRVANERFFLKDRIEKLEGKLRTECQDLMNLIKKNLAQKLRYPEETI